MDKIREHLKNIEHLKVSKIGKSPDFHGALHQSLHGGGHSRVSTALRHSPCRYSHGPNAPVPSARAYDASQAALGATVAVKAGTA